MNARKGEQPQPVRDLNRDANLRRCLRGYLYLATIRALVLRCVGWPVLRFGQLSHDVSELGYRKPSDFLRAVPDALTNFGCRKDVTYLPGEFLSLRIQSRLHIFYLSVPSRAGFGPNVVKQIIE